MCLSVPPGSIDVIVLVLEVVSRIFHAPISVQYGPVFVQSNALVDGASTTCCGNAIQQLTTLMLKNDFQTMVERRGTKNFFISCRCLWPIFQTHMAYESIIASNDAENNKITRLALTESSP